MDASAATDGRREVVVSAQGLARTLHDGSIALVLLNRLDHGSSTLSVSWAELGGAGPPAHRGVRRARSSRAEGPPGQDEWEPQRHGGRSQRCLCAHLMCVREVLVAVRALL